MLLALEQDETLVTVVPCVKLGWELGCALSVWPLVDCSCVPIHLRKSKSA
jgi:hypothetical protein